MWTAIFGLIPGAFQTINGITNAISNQKIAAIEATTEQERIKAEENVKVLEARRHLLLSAQARSKLPILIQTGLGLVGLIILAKLGLWDKVIGSFVGCAGDSGKLAGCETFNTDKLGTDLSILVGSVVAFYLVTTSRLFNK